jgi:N12 class adenine-specific DNA methylase
MLEHMEPKANVKSYFQPDFVPYYKFLHEKLSAADYVHLDKQEKEACRKEIVAAWPAYKTAYDKEVEDLISSRKDEQLSICDDKLRDIEANIKALEEVKPTDIPSEDIRVTMGATWLPIKYVKDFLVQELDLSYSEARKLKIEYSQASGKWHIDNKGGFFNTKIDQIYGTSDINALNLAELALNLKQPHVYKNTDDGKRVINPEATSAAQMKQEDLKRAFSEWIMKDEKRAAKVTALYNEKFNAVVTREYNGEYLRFPGMNPAIELKDHQKAAIAHTLYGGNTLFAHAVGAGKSATRS